MALIENVRRPLGLLAALPEEIAGLMEALVPLPDVPRVTPYGRRDFHYGSFGGEPCVVALSRIGKVAAAATAATMIARYDVAAVVFVGVAGGIAPHVQVGDVVVAEACVQHDLDASPLFPRWEVPLLDRTYFDVDTRLAEILATSAQSFLSAHGASPNALQGDAVPLRGAAVSADVAAATPTVHRGLLASGDRFVSSNAEREQLRRDFPELLAVDMESAAVAQVCHEYSVPFAAIRAISDAADDAASMSFPQFLTQVAAVYANAIVPLFMAAYARRD